MFRSVSLVPLTLALGLAPVILSSCAMRNPSTSLTVPTAHRLSQSRAALERRLQDLTEQAETRRYEQGMSAEVVRAETTYIRRRLQEGDFHTGDRVALIVESQDGPAAANAAIRTTEQQLTDTFTVGSQQEVTLPVVGVVSLRGVLRTELQPRLTDEIARYVRDPVVHAHALVGLTVTGELVKPGYYSVPPDAVLPAVMMAAGGTTHDAKLHDMMIQRQGEIIWEGDALAQAVANGRTIDDLGLLPGDVIQVPRTGNLAGLYVPITLLATLLTIPVTIYTLTRIF